MEWSRVDGEFAIEWRWNEWRREERRESKRGRNASVDDKSDE